MVLPYPKSGDTWPDRPQSRSLTRKTSSSSSSSSSNRRAHGRNNNHVTQSIGHETIELVSNSEGGRTLSETLDLYNQECNRVRRLSLRECEDEHLKRLDLTARQAGPDEATRLVRLNLSGIKLDNKALKKLGTLLSEHPSLREVRLGKTGLGKDASKIIFQSCQTNDRLRVLDLSDNKFSDAHVRILVGLLSQHSSSCQLQELDLSKNNSKNTYLSGTGASHLQKALIEGNNRHLTILKLSHNSLGVKGGEALGALLSKSDTLKELHVAGCQLGDKDGDIGLRSICEGLMHAITESLIVPALTYLDVSHNALHPESGQYLADILQSCITLRVLKLHNNGINNDGAICLAKAIPYSTSIRDLDLRENHIFDNGAVSLAEALMHKRCNGDLQLHWQSNADMTEVGLSRIAGALKLRQSRKGWLEVETKKLKVCSYPTCFTRSNLWDDELIDICDAIDSSGQRAYNFPVFQMGGNNITKRSIGPFASTFLRQTHVKLKNLYINGTRMGDDGAALLAEALMENNSLTNLRCTKCDLTDIGAVCFSRALSSGSHLALLELRQNRIGTEGARDLLNGAKDAPNLQSLILGANEISDFSPYSLSSVDHLRTLDLSTNQLTDDGAQELSRVLGNTLTPSSRKLK
eukprot:scaffold291_cov168-Amphora_coffeaeformis.AAC.1